MEPLFWLGMMVLFFFIEGFSVAVISSWFAIGSLAAMIASVCGAKLWLQILIFLVVSFALLACLRPLVKKFVNPKIVKTNVDSLIGTQGYVTQAIDNVLPSGQVKLGAMEWTARSSAGDNIPQGTLVKVDRIEGVRAFVSPVKVTEKV